MLASIISPRYTKLHNVSYVQYMCVKMILKAEHANQTDA